MSRNVTLVIPLISRVNILVVGDDSFCVVDVDVDVDVVDGPVPPVDVMPIGHAVVGLAMESVVPPLANYVFHLMIAVLLMVVVVTIGWLQLKGQIRIKVVLLLVFLL